MYIFYVQNCVLSFCDSQWGENLLSWNVGPGVPHHELEPAADPLAEV